MMTLRIITRKVSIENVNNFGQNVWGPKGDRGNAIIRQYKPSLTYYLKVHIGLNTSSVIRNGITVLQRCVTGKTAQTRT